MAYLIRTHLNSIQLRQCLENLYAAQQNLDETCCLLENLKDTVQSVEETLKQVLTTFLSAEPDTRYRASIGNIEKELNYFNRILKDNYRTLRDCSDKRSIALLEMFNHVNSDPSTYDLPLELKLAFSMWHKRLDKTIDSIYQIFKRFLEICLEASRFVVPKN